MKRTLTQINAVDIRENKLREAREILTDNQIPADKAEMAIQAADKIIQGLATSDLAESYGRLVCIEMYAYLADMAMDILRECKLTIEEETHETA